MKYYNMLLELLSLEYNLIPIYIKDGKVVYSDKNNSILRPIFKWDYMIYRPISHFIKLNYTPLQKKGLNVIFHFNDNCIVKLYWRFRIEVTPIYEYFENEIS